MKKRMVIAVALMTGIPRLTSPQIVAFSQTVDTVIVSVYDTIPLSHVHFEESLAKSDGMIFHAYHALVKIWITAMIAMIDGVVAGCSASASHVVSRVDKKGKEYRRKYY